MKKPDMISKIGGAHYDRLKHMVLIIGVDGKVKYINAKGASLLKYPKGIMVGKSWLKHFVTKEYHKSIAERIAAAVRKKKIEESCEYSVKCGDGKLRTIRWHNTLVFDDAGKTWGILKTGEDVTAQRLAEYTLRESEENYRTLVENIFQVVYRVDFKGDIRKIYPRVYPTFANHRVKKFSGYSIEEFQSGKFTFVSQIHPDDRVEAVSRFFKMVETKKTVYRTYRFRHKNGTYKWFEDTLIPRLDKKKNVAGLFGVIYEITDKVQQLETIKEYEKFFSIASDLFCISSPDGHFTKVNQSFERVLGYSAHEMVTRPFLDFVHPDDIEKSIKEVEKFQQGSHAVNFENRFIAKDGRLVWLSWTSNPPDDKGRGFATARDITEQKIKDDRMRENEAFLDSIVDNIPDMIFVKDAKDLKFVRFNKAGEELLGYKREDLIGKNDYDFFPKEEADFFTKKDREVLKGGKLLDIPDEEIETRRKGMRYLHTKKIPLYDVNGNPEYLLGISEDITDHKLAESRIMSALVKGQDTERRRIAEELHDSLGQKLSAIKLFVETGCPGGDASSVENVKKLNVMLNEIVEEVRNISHNLMPALIEDFGLAKALHNLCKKSSKPDSARVTFQAYDVKAAIDKSVKFGVYRMAQELINNALKHADADTITVQLFQRDKTLILTVEDDGKGFNTQKTNFEKTLGISSVKSRAKALNGIFNLDSDPGYGTIASIEIPLKK